MHHVDATEVAPNALWLELRFVYISVLITLVSPAKTDEPIEMPFGGWTLVGPRNHVFLPERGTFVGAYI